MSPLILRQGFYGDLRNARDLDIDVNGNAAWSEKWLKKVYNSANAIMTVATIDGRIAGFCISLTGSRTNRIVRMVSTDSWADGESIRISLIENVVKRTTLSEKSYVEVLIDKSDVQYNDDLRARGFKAKSMCGETIIMKWDKSNVASRSRQGS